MATVNIRDVSKQYGQHYVLHQVNLSIEKGEFIAVVGPSGCGKSTLLRLVAGLDEVSAGTILINDQCVNKTPASKRDIAMVFQSYALYPHMTVYDNMAYGLKMRKLPTAMITERVHHVARMLKLSDYLERKPQALSGGQRQRVAMGRAIVRSPAVFLFDEPLSNLDAKLRMEMRHEIKKLHQELNTTCLYVTHDQIEAMTMASRVVILNKGHIEQVDSPQMIYQRPASIFVAEFTGFYPVNFLNAVVKTTSQKVVSEWGLEWPLPIALSTAVENNEAVVLGIRPEHVSIARAEDKQKVSVKIMHVDDMGADKLLYAQCHLGGQRLIIRVAADAAITDEISVVFSLEKMTIFSKETGLRLGGWE